MGSTKATVTPKGKYESAPPSSQEGREARLSAMAFDALEQRIMSGQATGPEILYACRLCDTEHRKDMELKDSQIRSQTAKADSLDAQKEAAGSIEEVLAAMKRYQGIEDGFVDD